ncbi:MAG: nitronate monooxygenase [Chloroflexi bacterium]|nr:nitronate monooxygenase [Chloroflexota bacterium]
MFDTRITRLFGIKYPIIGGGMQFLSRAQLVAAISNAGGLGVIPAAMFPELSDLRQEIRLTKTLTNKPFGVNLTLFQHPRGVTIEQYIDVVLEEGIKIVETAGRSPEPYMKTLKDAGAKVMHKTPAVRFAKTAERVGVDAVAILGTEGAGHPGMDDITSMILITLAAETLKIPVVAAGGISNARSFVAALSLGAEGVLMGTRFAVTRESPAHQKVKEALAQAPETATALLERSLGNPIRALKNKAAQTILEMEGKGATADELLPYIRGEKGRKAWIDGDVDAGVVSIGQVVGLVHDIPTVKEVMDSMVTEAQALLGRLNKMAA